MASSSPLAAKQVPGTRFLVDGFRYTSPSVSAYFLTHAHSDHYTGIREDWSCGPIYCSEVTAQVIQLLLGVQAQYLRPLPLGQPTLVEGVEVTLVDANHCPGAVQLLFRLPNGCKYVHTGDMRYTPVFMSDPHLTAFRGADALYLDTTYCHPRHTFPAQEVSVGFITNTVRDLLQPHQHQQEQQPSAVLASTPAALPTSVETAAAADLAAAGVLAADRGAAAAAPARAAGPADEEESQGNAQLAAQTGSGRHKRLVLISTYGIGKERVLAGVAAACGWPIAVTARKLSVLRCLDMQDLDVDRVFTTDAASTPLRVVQWGFLGETWPFFRPNYVNMEALRQAEGADEVVGIVPTGWVHQKKDKGFPCHTKGACKVHLVPYSEHSSFQELQDYVRWLRPHKVVPTVGIGGEDGEAEAAKMQKYFRGLVDETASKAKFLACFGRPVSKKAAADAEADPAPAANASTDDAGVPGATSEPEAAQDGGDGGGSDARTQKRQAAGGRSGRRRGGSERASRNTSGGETCEGSMGRPDDRGGDDQQQRQCGRGKSLEAAKRQHDDEDAGLDAKETDDQVDAAVQIAREQNEQTELQEVEQQQGKKQQQRRQQQQQQQQRQQHISSTSRGDALQAAAGGGDSQTGVDAGAGTTDNDSTSAALAQLRAVLAPRGDSAGSAPASSDFGRSHTDGQPPQPAPQPHRQPAPPSAAGEGLGDDALRKLLAAAGGSAERALNWYFDGSFEVKLRDGGRAPGAGQPSQSQPTAAANSQAVQKQAGGNASGRGKRTSKGTGASGSSKRPKVGSTSASVASGQRSILSFFASIGAASTSLGGNDGGTETIEPQEQQHQQPAEATARPEEPAPASQLLAMHGVVVPFAPSPTAPGQARSPPVSAGGNDPAAAVPDAGPHPCCANQATEPRSPTTSTAPPAPAGANDPLVDAVTLPPWQFDPVKHACWRAGESAPYLHIARAFQAADDTTKRLRIGDIFTNMFRSLLALSPEDLVQAAYLTCGKIAPDYEGQELNVGGATCAAAVTEATGVGRARLREMYNELGDLGDVAQACKRTQATLFRPAPLTVRGVFATLRRIAGEAGKGAASRRQSAVLGLLRAARESETRYLVRTLVQALRVGANWRSVIPALARAVLLHREGHNSAALAASELPSKAALDAAGAAATAAFHICPNLELLIRAMLEHPLSELAQRCPMTPGVPIKPMLARPGEGPADALTLLKGQPFLAELKYDGMRAQIHLMESGRVAVFSRNCEDRSGAYPDVADQVRLAAAGGASSAIVDAELVAVERQAGNRIRAFQELASRSRTDVDPSAINVQICVYVFDLLYLNGHNLLSQPLRERRALLSAALPAMSQGYVWPAQAWEPPAALSRHWESTATGARPQPITPHGPAGDKADEGKTVASPPTETQTPLQLDEASASAVGNGTAAVAAEEHAEPEAEAETENDGEESNMEGWLRGTLVEAFHAGGEGLMLKSLAGQYQASKRSEHWIKLKRDYCEGLHDTLDLVVIGAWHGSGRKAGWHSPYLLAVYDSRNEELQSLCRCMSGFSDAFYRDAKQRLGQAQISGPRPYYRTSERPDVWFDACEVWEVRGADLTISPVHQAAVGLVHPERGLGLRFPRFVRVRSDKSIEDATSAEQVVHMYLQQTRKAVGGGGEQLMQQENKGDTDAQLDLHVDF